MLRTIEVSIVILILATAFLAATFFAVLPSPREISSPNLRQLALSTLQLLDNNEMLTETVFKDPTDKSWTDLHKSLSAILPPNLVYNLTVYDTVKTGATTTQEKFYSIANFESGTTSHSEEATFTVTSTDATFMFTPQKMAGTLYILNCSDANGWWITGHTAQTLAAELQDLLSPYFNTTVMVQNTTQLYQLLEGTGISNSPHEKVTNAVFINTFGEAVPIPSTYADLYPRGSYAEYCYELGKRVNQYNWTWVSIVGYPFYYVTNTVKLATSTNGWGIYGMQRVGSAGLNSFLQGLDVEYHPSYNYDGSWITGSIGVVHFSTEAHHFSNYYGIYPSPYQTSTRALPSSIQQTYHTTVHSIVFNPEDSYYGTATFRHEPGAFTAVGLTRTPDIRVAALGLLMYYEPAIYGSELTSYLGGRPTQRLVVLQLAQLGGS